MGNAMPANGYDTLLLPGIPVRRATPEDAGAIAAIHDDAMRWAFARGFRRRGPLALDSLRADAAERVAIHEVYVACEDGAPVATLVVTWNDEGLWDDVPGDAGYVYAFAVKRSYAGQGVGRALLDWAGRYVSTTGRPLLRLECDADNPGLRAYYEVRAGFTHRGDAWRGERALARYEKAVEMDTIRTPHGDLTVAQAAPEDLEAILAIGDDVDAWLLARGITPGVPPRPMREIVADRIACGAQYLARVRGEPAGNIVLEWVDDGVWSDLPGDACYVHGFAVSRAHAGIGIAMLRGAERFAAERGKRLLRLDCTAENAGLRAYYARAGFTDRGVMALAHRNAARYEKDVGPDVIAQSEKRIDDGAR
jgi:GNAT superfamily N-acetyltransferase